MQVQTVIRIIEYQEDALGWLDEKAPDRKQNAAATALLVLLFAACMFALGLAIGYYDFKHIGVIEGLLK